jgi:hypothetical protein
VAVALAGDYAYVAASSFGLGIVDVSDPAQPTQVGVYDTPGAAFGVAVAGDLAYIADSSALRIADVSDPSQPIEVASYETDGLAVNVATTDDLIYVATSGGLLILRLRTPGPPPSTELVNGDFEGGFYLQMGQSVANGWTAFAFSGQPSFAGEGFTVFDGRWAYKISGYGPFAAGLAQTVGVQPGRTYQVTTYYQLYPPGDGEAFLGVQDGESATQWIGDSWPGVWRPLSQTVTPTSERLTITLQGSSGAAPNTNVYFDEVTMVIVGAP